MPEEKKNPFIENLSKFIGREVIVCAYVGGSLQQFEGKCEAIDFQHKGVIIKRVALHKTETLFIPRYYKLIRSKEEE